MLHRTPPCLPLLLLVLVVLLLPHHTALATTTSSSMFRKGCQRSAFAASPSRWVGRLASSPAVSTTRRPSSLGFLSTALLVGSSRYGVAATNTAGTSGFCSNAANASPVHPILPSQTCLAAAASSGDSSSSSSSVAPPPAPSAASLQAVSSPNGEKKKLQPKYRASYRQPDYWIRHTDLLFQIVPDPDPSKAAEGATVTYVTSTLTVKRNAAGGPTLGIPNLELDGEELELLEVKVNGQALPWDGTAFVLTAEQDLLVLGKTIEAASGTFFFGLNHPPTHPPTFPSIPTPFSFHPPTRRRQERGTFMLLISSSIHPPFHPSMRPISSSVKLIHPPTHPPSYPQPKATLPCKPRSSFARRRILSSLGSTRAGARTAPNARQRAFVASPIT